MTTAADPNLRPDYDPEIRVIADYVRDRRLRRFTFLHRSISISSSN